MSRRRSDFMAVGEPTNTHCKMCGGGITRRPNEPVITALRRKYCSEECRAPLSLKVGEPTGSNCLTCGEPIVRHQRKNGTTESGPAARRRKFCNPECKGAFDRDSVLRNFWNYVDIKSDDECWEWKGPRTGRGYGNMRLYDRGAKPRFVLAHRVAWELAKGPTPDGLWILHGCDNPGCINPHHLHTGTCAENNRERTERGRNNSRFGNNHHNSKLTSEDAVKILELAAAGNTHATIGMMFGVHRITVWNVIHGKTWSHTTGVTNYEK